MSPAMGLVSFLLFVFGAVMIAASFIVPDMVDDCDGDGGATGMAFFATALLAFSGIAVIHYGWLFLLGIVLIVLGAISLLIGFISAGAGAAGGSATAAKGSKDLIVFGLLGLILAIIGYTLL